MPERFNLTYVGEDGQNIHRPVVIHRGIISTMERFTSYLIEEYKGVFPIWLSPEQVSILPISEKFNEYAYKIKDELSNNGIRVFVDDRAEKIGLKIREAQLKKIPYSIIIGQKEAETGTVSVRKRYEGDKGTLSIDDFKAKIIDEINNKIS